jgi:hypothetical protein
MAVTYVLVPEKDAERALQLIAEVMTPLRDEDVRESPEEDSQG